MYVFFDTECTQNFEKLEGSFELIPNLISGWRMCSKCEVVDDLSVNSKQCGKRTHMFWTEDPVGKFIDYLRSLVHSRQRSMLYHITLVVTTHSICCGSFWN